MFDVLPVNSYGPIMPGLIMAAVAIVHVFLAQFAVGGGFLLCYFQWIALKTGSPYAKQFVKGYMKVLILISFVLGAITGVGIWFTAIQVSAQTIGTMVFQFHWLWAAEWTFFCLEIVAGYAFYRYQKILDDKSTMILLGLYAFAAWMSLFIINGIISWQLTPGAWVETQTLWDGFFNPTFWPSLFFRTIVSLTLSSLAACVIVNAMPGLDREGKEWLINRIAYLLLPMLLMPILGAWFIMAMPDDSRSWVLGGSPAMMLFLQISIAASLAIGGYAFFGLFLKRLYINGATALLLMMLAFGATAGGEFVREGSRKPYSIRHVLYSNAIEPEDVARMRKVGCLADDSYPLRGAEELPNQQLVMGAKVFRRQCSVCHTMQGTNGVGHLTGSWDGNQIRMNIAKLQQTKPFMPPFAGTAEELESLVQFILYTNSGKPKDWELSKNSENLESIQKWLDEAGVEPGNFEKHLAKGGH